MDTVTPNCADCRNITTETQGQPCRTCIADPTRPSFEPHSQAAIQMAARRGMSVADFVKAHPPKRMTAERLEAFKAAAQAEVAAGLNVINGPPPEVAGG